MCRPARLRTLESMKSVLAAAAGPKPRSLVLPPSLALALQFLLTLGCLTWLLQLWQLDLRVPFNYWGDSIFELMLAKSIADGGWIWSIQRLGAPFELDIGAFPQNLAFSSLIMKFISIFTGEPGLVLNLFWIFSVALTSVVCHAVLRPLGLTRPSAFAFATLYALLPHAFYRNIAHISLTYMFVPVVCTQALLVLSRVRQAADDTGTTPQARLPWQLVVLAGLAIGADYIYNAFFSCFYLTFAGLAAFLVNRNGRALAGTLPLVVLIALVALVNLSPSLQSWQQNGVPATINYKGPAEAEFYGLKIRHLVSPVALDVLAPEEIRYPIENENAWAKLGGIGGIGFVLALFAGLFARRRGDGNQLWAAGVLASAGLLLATVGGFGAIFNVIVTPDIRAYNRISVFIAFFAFYALFHLLERVRARSAVREPRVTRAVHGAIVIGIFLIGLFDQGAAATSLVANHDQYRVRFDVEREFVGRIERVATGVHQVFQLPIAPFPGDSGREQMWPYDHGRPYLWSQRFKWSWPALSNVQTAFESRLNTGDPATLVDQLVKAGFDGLWVDRAGFRSEAVQVLEGQLSDLVEASPLVSDDQRYVFFDLGHEARRWAALAPPELRRKESRALTEPVVLDFSSGFYGEEVSEGGLRRHRWSGAASKIKFRNTASVAKKIEFTTSVQASPRSSLSIRGSRGLRQQLDLSSGEGRLTVSMTLEPGERAEVELAFDGPRIAAPGDARAMYFAFVNPKLRDTEGSL